MENWHSISWHGMRNKLFLEKDKLEPQGALIAHLSTMGQIFDYGIG